VAKLEFKWVIRASLLFSILINIGHGWEYQVVQDLALSDSVEYIYGHINGDSFSDYPQANQDQPYFIYSILYFVINFCVFFIFNTGVEVKIVRRMHKELKDKRERLAKMNASNSRSSQAVETCQTEEDRKKEEEDGKKERRVIKMVAINGLLNFILRASDMLFWLENKNISVLLNIGSQDSLLPGIFSLITDLGYFAFILTFTTNFVIYYKFNLKFKEALIFFRKTPKK
jgi:hypothetical protein